MTAHRYVVIWIDEHGTRQYPGCTEDEAAFGSRREAEAAIQSLRETDPATWADADLDVEQDA